MLVRYNDIIHSSARNGELELDNNAAPASEINCRRTEGSMHLRTSRHVE